MLAILFRAVASRGGRDDLLNFLRKDSQESTREPGTLRFDVIGDPENDHAFFVYELYRDAAAFAAHQRGTAFREWQERIKPSLASFSILAQGGPAAVLSRVGGEKFDSKSLPVSPNAVAPDGSDVRVLLGLIGGGMAHFELGPNQISRAVTHRTVDEIWFFLSGRGQMWRKQDGHATIVEVSAGVCLTIPLGTHFQFRSMGDQPLAAVGVTMPPWPGEGEAVVVDGEWTPTVTSH